jgi:hypothetical protein
MKDQQGRWTEDDSGSGKFIIRCLGAPHDEEGKIGW